MKENTKTKEPDKEDKLNESIRIFLMIIIYTVAIGGGIELLGCKLKLLGIKGIHPYINILSDMIPYVILLKIINKKYNYKIKFNRIFKLSYYIYIVFIFLGYNLVYDSTIGFLLERSIKNSWYIEITKELMKNSFTAFISIVIIPPIFEEIFFRGIILEQLLKKYKPVKAVFISSMLFAIIHFNIIQGITALLFGGLVGYVYIKLHSTLPCIFLHCLNNLFFYITFLYPTIYKIEFNVNRLVLGSMILGVSIYIFRRKQYESKISMVQQ